MVHVFYFLHMYKKLFFCSPRNAALFLHYAHFSYYCVYTCTICGKYLLTCTCVLITCMIFTAVIKICYPVISMCTHVYLHISSTPHHILEEYVQYTPYINKYICHRRNLLYSSNVSILFSVGEK